jgi:aspartyl-tRNA(Asn)/glutamyl-tRNA(Gln) amidotransferase subunit B
MKYQTVIGLEVHVQAKTKSKMFCSCSAEYFGSEPNTHVCPVCLGLPGALPVPNKAAIDLCVKVALGLNCKVSSESKFDRKNYFYPDLPKAYQISQYDQPIGHDGFLEIDMGDDARRIRIRRVHQEEDTGKSTHAADRTLLDFNKSGVPLMEIVTEPDFQSVEEVNAFAKLLRQTVIDLGASDAEMQKGQMRFELNISLRTPEDGTNLPNYRVEVKNIGSISVLEKVIAYEVERQSELLDKGEKLKNETRGLVDMTGETTRQRVKETEDDYRYFPEPDIPPLSFTADYLQAIKDGLPELPGQRKSRLMETFGLDSQQAEVLVYQPEKGAWIDSFHQKYADAKVTTEAIKWLVGEISGLLDKNQIELANLPVALEDLHFLVTQLQAGSISGAVVKQVLAEAFAGNLTAGAQDFVEKNNLALVQDEGQLEAWVDQVIAENQTIINSIAKNPNAAKALIGKVMALSKGKASAQKVDALLKKKLQLPN